MKTIVFLGVTLIVTSLSGISQAASIQGAFHVAPSGSDANCGSAEQPFATVGRARDAVRAKIAAGLHEDLTVLIRGGVYAQKETLRFGPEDSGTETHAITYAAYPGEKVVLSGGRTITGWQKGPGNVWTTEMCLWLYSRAQGKRDGV